LIAIPAAACVVIEEATSRRATRAHEALHAGLGCPEFVSVAERFANEESAREARGACASRSTTTVTLNFSSGMSLNYLITVAVSSEGHVTAVSEVGAW
jgi:hypothetical protein